MEIIKLFLLDWFEKNFESSLKEFSKEIEFLENHWIIVRWNKIWTTLLGKSNQFLEKI